MVTTTSPPTVLRAWDDGLGDYNESANSPPGNEPSDAAHRRAAAVSVTSP